MTEPAVCAICLTRDRPELAKRAVECFRKQTYEKRLMLIWDTGKPPSVYPERGDKRILDVFRSDVRLTIGALRNAANEYAAMDDAPCIDILIHWDDDDWSHPNRIAEQVALLQASGADVVGYREMLFWREIDALSTTFSNEPLHRRAGEAWLYTATRGGVPALGTSLCYWRKTWERHHFANETQGVEDHWMREKNVVAISSLWPEGLKLTDGRVYSGQPRMIARIHGANTSNGYDLEKHVANGSREWKRVPSWDAHVREILG